MSNDEFDRLVRRLGFRDQYGLGRLNHWPSGKLYRPMSYYDIKELVEKVLEDRDKPEVTYDTRGVDPWDRTTWMNARPVAAQRFVCPECRGERPGPCRDEACDGKGR